MATQTKVEWHLDTMLAEARQRNPDYTGPFKIQIHDGRNVILSTTSDALVNSVWTLDTEDTEKLREAAKSGGQFWLVILQPVFSMYWDARKILEDGEQLCR